MSTVRLRRIWLRIHRWLGLSVGFLLVVTGVTGSVLVFRSALDEQLYPEIFQPSLGEFRCNVDQILAAARSAPLSDAGQISFVDFPKSDGGVWTVWYRSGPRESSRLIKAYFDPSFGELRGRRVHGDDLLSWIYNVHVNLLAGAVGRTVVGLSGIALLISLLTGVVLWWPLWKHSWRAAFSIRRGSRWSYDLHKVGGIGSGAVLSVVAFTGVYLTFPKWVAPGVNLVLGSSSRATSPVRSGPADGRSRVTAGQALDAVKARYPQAEIRRLHPPASAEGTFIVRFRTPGDVNHGLGSSRAWIDQFGGTILNVSDGHQRSAADTFFAWQLPLHNGEAFGMAGRWLVFVTGFAPLALGPDRDAHLVAKGENSIRSDNKGKPSAGSRQDAQIEVTHRLLAGLRHRIWRYA